MYVLREGLVLIMWVRGRVTIRGGPCGGEYDFEEPWSYRVVFEEERACVSSSSVMVARSLRRWGFGV